MGGQWSLGVALVMECWPERHRPKLAGAIGAAANVGFLFIAVVALTRQVTDTDWRWMMLVGASPAVLALLIAFFVPESERWKAAVEEGRPQPDHGDLRPRPAGKTLLAMAFAAIPLIGTWAAISGLYSHLGRSNAEARDGQGHAARRRKSAQFEAAANPKDKRHAC